MRSLTPGSKRSLTPGSKLLPKEDYGFANSQYECKSFYGPKFVPPVHHQRSSQACTVYAVTAAMSISQALKEKKSNNRPALDFDKDDVIDGIPYPAPFAYSKVYYYMICRGAILRGQHGNNIPRWNIRLRVKVSLKEAVDVLRRFDPIAAAVTATIPWFKSFASYCCTTEVYCPRPVEPPTEQNHALCLTGFDVVSGVRGFSKPIPVFHFQDSKGVNFGVNGHGRVHAKLLYDFSIPYDVAVGGPGKAMTQEGYLQALKRKMV